MAPISLLKSYPIFMKVKITRKIDLLDLNKSHLDKKFHVIKSVTLVFEKSTAIDKNRGLNQKANLDHKNKLFILKVTPISQKSWP